MHTDRGTAERLGRDRVARLAGDVENQGLEWPDERVFRDRLERVCAASDFAYEAIAADPAELADMWRTGGLAAGVDTCDVVARAGAALNDAADADDLKRRLRRYRRRALLVVAWRDLVGIDGLDDTLAALTRVAEIALAAALDRLTAWQEAELGVPRDADGRRQRLVVFGLGKLGGGELNFSSDIDVVLAYPADGQTDGRRSLDNETFFRRLAQRLVAALDERTPEGFVFRVDTRLRPHGASGRLALSFSAMEQYFQREGREWERYAWIKARPIAGDSDAGWQLLRELRPFVYRRYLDFAAFDALREMKRLIRAEVARRELTDDIKLGAGGIREIEFIVQAFQLIRGGREPALREPALRRCLQRLGELALLERHEVEGLDAAYVFLRRLENRLQMLADRQTHRLPQDATARARIACAMGCDDWDELRAELDAHREFVAAQFQAVFAQSTEGEAEDSDDATGSWAELWPEPADERRALQRLRTAGYRDPEAALGALSGLRDGHALRGLSASARARLDRFVPQLLRALEDLDAAPDEALQRTLRLLASIASRSAYIALLEENPPALQRLVDLCHASAWVAELVAQQPVLLDELIDPRTLEPPAGRAEAAETLRQRLSTTAAGDQEQELEALREARRSLALRVAAAELDGVLTSAEAADRLSDVAEAVLDETVRLAQRDRSAQYGAPQAALGDEPPHYAVIAYGKLGSRELGYGSDLDLVFLHTAEAAGTTAGPRRIDNARYYLRLTQRIIHMLTALTPAGRLYEVDTRLRPNGRAGLLVSSFTAYADYQRRHAWLWELQALVRARWVAGERELEPDFETLRAEVLRRRREPTELADAVQAMRRRMLDEAGRSQEGFDIKRDPGGLIDIEFIAQYLVLAHAADHADLCVPRDTPGILSAGVDAGALAEKRASALIAAYHAYMSALHRCTLDLRESVSEPQALGDERAAVTEAWSAVLDSSSG